MDILHSITTGTTALAMVATCVVFGCDPESGEEETSHSSLESTVETGEDRESSPEVVAVVNEREITRTQIDQRLERLDELHRHSRRPADESLRSERRERLIQRLIDRELLREYVAERNIDVDTDDVDHALQRRVDAKFGSSSAFRRYLDAHNLSTSDYRTQIREELAVNKMLEDRAQLDSIDEDELRSHYERIANRRPADERVQATVWTIDGDGSSRDDNSDRFSRKLDDRLEEIGDADTFDELVADSDFDVDIRPDETRWFEPTQLQRPAADAVFDDDAPSTGPITVEASTGLELYWIHERRDPGIRQFDEVEDLLRDRARRSKLETERRQLLNKLRDDADIVVYLPPDPEHSNAARRR